MPAVLSELVEQLPQRAVGHAKLLRDVFRRSPIDKHGAECFVAAVIGIGWLDEEVAAGGIIHDPYSPKMSVGFWGRTGPNRKPIWAAPSMRIGAKPCEHRLLPPVVLRARPVSGRPLARKTN